MSKTHKYISLFKISFLYTLKNTKGLISLSVFFIACLIIFSRIWEALSSENTINMLSSSQLLWYIAFNEWVIVSLPEVHEEMKMDLKSGHLAYLLPRPISYLGATFSKAFGSLMANLLVLGIIAFAFTIFQTRCLPFSFFTLLTAFIFGIFAGIIATLFQMLIGLSAFWIEEVDPLYWIWQKLLFMLGGLMLPLAAYPNWIQKLANLTPFPSILGERSALAISISSTHILSLILSYLGWSSLVIGLLLLTYKKGLKILNLGGG